MAPKPAAGSPSCIAKLNFIAHSGESKMCRDDLNRVGFAQYLIGEGKGEDGTLPTMFTAADHDPPKAFRDAWLRRDRSIDPEQIGWDGQRWPIQQAWCAEILRQRLVDEPRHYRLMVSPAEKWGKQVDMQEFAQRLMTHVETDLRRRFYWVASAHYNTDRPHIHVGIRGMDREHAPVFFPKPYVKSGIMWRGQAVLAEMIAEQKAVKRAG